MSTGHPFAINEGIEGMMVIGADTHKRQHTLAAVDEATGRVAGEKTVTVKRFALEDMVRWARGLGEERVWAIEDCRHVSGGLERVLLACGERVVRVPPMLMAGMRRGARERGKSDAIDAVAIARAAIREGIDTLPAAQLAGPELEVRLLVDHRERLVSLRTGLINDLRWNLHDLWPELEIPSRSIHRSKSWQERIGRRLADADQTARVRIARDELRRVRDLTRTIDRLEREIAGLVAKIAPQLLAEQGCAALTAAKLVGEIAGIDRFKTEAKLARMAGVAPIPASSGRSDRHRLDRGGNRQLNAALHRIAITKARFDPETRAFLARKHAEGKNRSEALRCLKRHLVRRVWHLLQPADPAGTAIGTRPPVIAQAGVTITCSTTSGPFSLT